MNQVFFVGNTMIDSLISFNQEIQSKSFPLNTIWINPFWQ